MTTDAQLDLLFGALADRTRRGIIERLAGSSMRVTDLAAEFSISLPAVSKHLRILERAGFVRRKREGREHHLSFEGAPLTQVNDWLRLHQTFWEESLDALEAHLNLPESETKPNTPKS